ncbi:MAG: acyl-CoA thioesterase [Myxococcota bacterium]
MSNETTNPLPERKLTMTLLMTPDKANFSGKVHGGQILKMLDEVAYACASRYCRTYVVTISVDQVVFKEAIHVGELVTFLSSINYTGRTSMEVGIRVVTENVPTRVTRHAMTCYFTMVSVDEDGAPVEVPPYSPQTPEEHIRFQAAKLRRELRKEVAKRHAEIKSARAKGDASG